MLAITFFKVFITIVLLHKFVSVRVGTNHESIFGSGSGWTTRLAYTTQILVGLCLGFGQKYNMGSPMILSASSTSMLFGG